MQCFNFLALYSLNCVSVCFVALVYVASLLAKYFFLTNKKEFPFGDGNAVSLFSSVKSLFSALKCHFTELMLMFRVGNVGYGILVFPGVFLFADVHQVVGRYFLDVYSFVAVFLVSLQS